MEPHSTRPIGRTKVSVTQMGFGGAPLGNLYKPVPEEDAEAVLDSAWSAGLRFFDTAPYYGYGLSERRVGERLRRRRPGEFVLSTKVGRVLIPRGGPVPDNVAFPGSLPFAPLFDYSYDGFMRSYEDSLQRLGQGRIDILLIHDLAAETHGNEAIGAHFRMAMRSGYRALEELKRNGDVGAIGFGLNDWQPCLDALKLHDFDCCLLAGRYTLLEQGALDEFLPECERRGVSIIIGGPFNSGILAGGTTYNYAPAPPDVLERVRRIEAVCRSHGVPLPAAALQFPLTHPAVASVIPGAKAPAEVEANIKLLRQPIPATLWRDLKSEGLLRQDAPTP
jgi:D-threo-aldose 1-dehydrogenase